MSYSFSYEYNTDWIKNLSTAELIAFIAVTLIVTIIMIMAEWRIFEKAGEAGWKCLIPIYSTYTQVKFVTGNGWLFLLMLVPIVNIIFVFWVLHQKSKSFGEGFGFTLGLIFLTGIFELILGFSKNIQYVGPKGIPVEEEREFVDGINE